MAQNINSRRPNLMNVDKKKRKRVSGVSGFLMAFFAFYFY
jgi:hypothetical protein